MMTDKTKIKDAIISPLNQDWFYFKFKDDKPVEIIGLTEFSLKILSIISEKPTNPYDLMYTLNINNSVVTIGILESFLNLLWTLETYGYIRIVTSKSHCNLNSLICSYNLELSISTKGKDILFGVNSMKLNNYRYGTEN